MIEPNTMTYDLAESRGSSEIGGKASGLRSLASAGMPVPPGEVVPASVPDSRLDHVADHLADRFAGESLAVRSSGIGEDSRDVSFAGQFETVLNVPARSDVIVDAIRRVRASATRAAASTYSTELVEMAVLIMPMVDAQAAGVAFTRDPISGDRVTVVEAIAGLGDKLASGELAGERWRVGDTTTLEHSLSVLTADQAEAVAELANRCERTLGTPQDIEWAITAGNVVLLQSRPITTVDDVEPIPITDETPAGPWEWDSTHNRLPMTPLTASVFIPGFERASKRLAETYGVPISHLAMRSIRGYLYVQIVPPAGKAGSPTPPKPVMRALFSVVPLLRQRKKAARRVFEDGVDRKLLSEWRDSVAPETNETLDQLYDVSRSEVTDVALAQLIDQAAELQQSTFSWNMATDPAYLLPLVELNDFVEAELDAGMGMTTELLAGASPSDYLHSSAALAASLPDDVQGALAAGGGVDALDSDSADLYAAHLRVHGPRVMGFDLSCETHLEDQDRELARIATARKPTDPSPAAAALASTLRAQLDPGTTDRFDQLLEDARDVYSIREEGEAVHARVCGMLRLFALEAGDRMVKAGHLIDRNHVMFLRLSELTGWLESPTDLRSVAQVRRGQHKWAAARSPEPFLGPEAPMPPLDIFPPDVQRIMRLVEIITTHDMRPADLADGIDGVAASAGVHTGPVRLVVGPDDFDRVQPGDVLVSPITTSPWEVLFPHIGALVTEGGGLLSHPAIVAREYALPAVVGCEGAMGRFHDGQLVRVDGAAGTVTPIEEAKPREEGST
ncbi:MAG: PEP/pyruvate-binding domain-containing protein [Acidimicrobiia bacterium]